MTIIWVILKVSSIESYENLKSKNLSMSFEDESTDMLKLSRWYKVFVFAEQELVLLQEFKLEDVCVIMQLITPVRSRRGALFKWKKAPPCK